MKSKISKRFIIETQRFCVKKKKKRKNGWRKKEMNKTKSRNYSE